MILKSTLVGLGYDKFRRCIGDERVDLYTMRNRNGYEVVCTNYGARVVSIVAPDREGKPVDVAAGHDNLDDYLSSPEPYLGAICGRYANRIAGGRFTLNDKTYQLPVNDPPNSLHGGPNGFHTVPWYVRWHSGSHLSLLYISRDGEEGYPGTLRIMVDYSLTEKNELLIFYDASTSSPTILNPTNHTYFNLSGAGEATIEDHLLYINADYYLPIDATGIPYGEKAPVAGTPMDFRQLTPVGARINDPFEQLAFGKGYDHTFILNKPEKLIPTPAEPASHCARCISPKTGIVMDVHTTEPGVQLYTGNYLNGTCRGKFGQSYPVRSALCLETQHFPDSPNRPEYPSTVLLATQRFFSRTLYTFSTDSELHITY